MLRIAWDKIESDELNPRYFVYDDDGDDDHFVVLYKGTYAQCLCIVGAFSLDPALTLEEIQDKTNGFLNSIPRV